LIITKSNIWEHENPICAFKVNILNKGYFLVPSGIAKKMSLDQNMVVLFRLESIRDKECTSKLSKLKYSKNSYVLKIRNKVLREYKGDKQAIIEIVKIKKIENNPIKLYIHDGLINIYSLMNDFICFERSYDWITIYGPKGGMRSVTVPRYIKIDEILLWGLGFYMAEGLKGGLRFGVSNEKPYLIKLFQNYAERYLGIERSDWHGDVSIMNKNDLVKPYWAKELGLELNQIKLKIVNKKPPKAEYGVISTNVYRKILGELQNRLINTQNIREIIKQDKDLALAFIRGLEAGDGCVMDKSNCIEPTITCLKEHAQLVYDLLSLIYNKQPLIRDSHTCDKVVMVYYRGNNMTREYIINGNFREHKDRRTKLITLFKDKRPTEVKYLKALLTPRSIRELSVMFGVTYPASKMVLKYLKRFDLIKGQRTFINNGKRDYTTRYFSLSERGAILLKELNTIPEISS